MFPGEFLQRIDKQAYIDVESLLDALEQPSPSSIRVNPYKWNFSPVNGKAVPWCRDGFYLDTRPSYTLDPHFHAGCYYPQEASGMFLEYVLDQTRKQHEYIKVLDLCGAPGGKSTHLSSLLGQNGLLVANEVIRHRAAVLAESVTKWGLSNVIVTQNDPSSFNRLKGYFDVILVDAPCSGEGMFRDRKARNEWSVKNTEICSERQKRILMDVWPALREDGILIYSTCTFNPSENEENVRWLSSRHNTESIELDMAGFPGIATIAHEGITGYGFYPGRIEGEGLFFSVLRKKDKQEFKLPVPGRSTIHKPSVNDLSVISKWTSFPAERIIKNGNEIIALPGTCDDFTLLSENLRVIKHGTRICEIKNNDYIPAHDLALSMQIRKDAFSAINLDLSRALSFLKKESFNINNPQHGWMLVMFDDINLGFVNNLGNRFNNYYPVEWRIKMQIKADEEKNIILWDM